MSEILEKEIASKPDFSEKEVPEPEISPKFILPEVRSAKVPETQISPEELNLLLCKLVLEVKNLQDEVEILKQELQYLRNNPVKGTRSKKEQPTSEMLEIAEKEVNSNMHKVFTYYDFEPVISAWWARKVCRELSKQGKIRKVGNGKFQAVLGAEQIKSRLSFSKKGVPKMILDFMREKPEDHYQPKEFVHIATIGAVYKILSTLEKAGYVQRDKRGYFLTP